MFAIVAVVGLLASTLLIIATGALTKVHAPTRVRRRQGGVVVP